MPSATALSTPRLHDGHTNDLQHWARVLDENPDTIRRAIQQTGPEFSAVRTFLFDRQLGLDFDASAADVAAGRAADAPG